MIGLEHAVVQVDPGVFAVFVAAVLGSGGLGAWFTFRSTSRKQNAESEGIAARTLIAVNKELREELSRRDALLVMRESEINRRLGEIGDLRERIAVLEAHHPGTLGN